MGFKPLNWTACLLAATGMAAAADGARAGNGCPEGSYSTTVSPDGNAATFLFDDLHATTGNGPGGTRIRCRVSAPVESKRGYSVFSVDYRGFAVQDDGQAVMLSDGRTRRRLFGPDGRFVGDFNVHQQLGTGGGRPLDLSVLLEAEGGGADAAEIYLDSIDLAQIGYTTDVAVRRSLDAVAEERRELIARSLAAAEPLLGLRDPLRGADDIAVFTSAEGAGGVRTRIGLTDRLTFLGGIAYLPPGGGTVDAEGALLLGGALRYRQPIDTSWSLFGEVGGWASPRLSATYQRLYANGDDPVSTTNRASATLLGAETRLGVALTPNDADEFSLSLRLARSRLGVASYAEDATAGNLFAARFSGRPTIADQADLTLSWTRQWTGTIDTTVFASFGRAFGNNTAVRARVDWVGKAEGGWEAQTVAAAGARIGWRLSGGWTMDSEAGVSVEGGNRADWSLGLRLRSAF
jgi:hypothetical protein